MERKRSKAKARDAMRNEKKKRLGQRLGMPNREGFEKVIDSRMVLVGSRRTLSVICEELKKLS